MRGTAPSRSALFAFSSVSFAYFSYAGLFGTYAPLWFQSLGFSTFAIGVLASLQSSTRLFSPYAWGWLADHSGRRTQRRSRPGCCASSGRRCRRRSA